VAKQVAMRAGQFLFQRIFFDPAIDSLYVPESEQDNTPAQIEEGPYSALCHRAVLVQLGTAIQLENVRFYARDLASNIYGLRSDLHRLTELKKIIFVVPEYHAHLVRNCRTYFQYSCRIVSLLAMQEAYRVRKTGEVNR
jgi:hypothetical protein